MFKCNVLDPKIIQSIPKCLDHLYDVDLKKSSKRKPSTAEPIVNNQKEGKSSRKNACADEDDEPIPISSSSSSSNESSDHVSSDQKSSDQESSDQERSNQENLQQKNWHKKRRKLKKKQRKKLHCLKKRN